MLIPTGVRLRANQAMETINFFKRRISRFTRFRTDRRHIARGSLFLRHHKGRAITAITFERRMHNGPGLALIPDNPQRQVRYLLDAHTGHLITQLFTKLLMQGGNCRIKAIFIHSGNGITGGFQRTSDTRAQGKFAVHLPVEAQGNQLWQIGVLRQFAFIFQRLIIIQPLHIWCDEVRCKMSIVR